MKKMMKNWLVLGALAMCIAPALVACNDDDDEKIIETLTPEIGISQIAIGADGGVSTLGINPTGDWTISTTASWLTLSPASGTADVKEITLTAEANPTFATRSATLSIKVGDTEMTKTVVQKALQKKMSIYSNKITFSMEVTEFEVAPIIANFQPQLVAKPTWVESVEITAEPEGYYSAYIVLKEKDYDTELRQDTIVFGDGADYTQKFAIECSAFTNLIVELPEEMEREGKANSATVGVYAGVNCSVLLYSYDPAGDARGVLPFEEGKEWATVANSSLSSAVEKKEYVIHFAEYKEAAGTPVRYIAMYIIPEDEVAEFSPLNTSRERYVFTQNNAFELPIITTGPDMTASVPQTFTFRLAQGTAFEVRLLDSEMLPLEATGDAEFDFGEAGMNINGICTATEVSATTADGYTTYVYEVSISQNIGRDMPIGDFAVVLKNEDGTYQTAKVDSFFGQIDAYVLATAEVAFSAAN